METDEQLVYWTAALTIATFLLAIVAVFQEKIKNCFFKPVLKCSISIEPPDCHFLKSHSTFYLRFKILNSGNVSAKNVEVILKNLKDEFNLLPVSLDNLLWSSYIKENSKLVNVENNLMVLPTIKERIYWDYISPSTYQYCNLGFVSKPEEGTKPKLQLSVYWPSTNLGHLLEPGKYEFELVVGCENGKSITVKYYLDFLNSDAEWTEDERRFLKKIIIKEKT